MTTTKKEMLKSAVLFAATDLLEGRISTPELVASGAYLIEEISNTYELKLLKEQLHTLKGSIEDLEYFEMTVRPVDYVKKEVIEARIETLKGYIADTNRVNRIVEKAVQARPADTLAEVKEEVTTTTVEIEGVEIEEVYNNAFVATFKDGFELVLTKYPNYWVASKSGNVTLTRDTMEEAVRDFRIEYCA